MSDVDVGSGWASGPGWDLHCGPYQSALSHVGMVDTLVTDTPYSERTHASHSPRTDVLTACERDARWAARGGKRSTINYDFWTPSDVAAFVESWSARVRGWFVSITDSELYPAWRDALRGADRYVFAPLPFVETGSRVRLAGDGPSNWACWTVVARPRTADFHSWGTLDGAHVDPLHGEYVGSYVGPAERKPVTGGKSLHLMRALVRDYSRPGDVVCDPCAGGGTTLLAALMEGRRAVGAEMMPEHFEIARKRLSRGFTPPLIREEREAEMEQLDLTGEP